jgi:hypothetical protein
MIAKIKENINWWKDGFKDKGFKIRFLSAIIGFGISGILWGIECYSGTIARNEALTNPFSFILGAIYFGVIGSISLIIFREKDIKKVIKFVLVGLVGWLVAFLLPNLFMWWLIVFGSVLFSLLNIIFYIIEFFHEGIGDLFQTGFLFLTSLKPSLMIFVLWLEFFFSGVIAAISFILFFKTKIRLIILRTGICFAAVSLISPIIGNLTGTYIFNSLFLAYLITFLLIGIGFGLPFFKLLEKQNK